MIPKYSNPSVLLGSTAIVSRAALRDDSEDEAEPAETIPEHAQLVARLENILKRSIDETSLPQSGDKDEHSPRKKKRRKVEEGGLQSTEQGVANEEVVVPFRLLSSVSQPKPIVLVPKAPPKIISHGPAVEDTKAEAKRRAIRAREVAVDYTWVVESSKARTYSRASSEKVEHLVAQVPDRVSPLLVLEKPKPPPKPPRVAQSNPEIEIEPSPHEPEVSCCPVLAARDPMAQTTKRKRRRGKVRDKPAIQATFWRPSPGVGGKALGYAWGYAGSRPTLPDDSPRGYERDTMKKAVFEFE
ncbi:hypothetical protein L226DRAFT_55355 [Lentinus tigrinus ALCF2SS1-7]|uniref:Uncharacterized protein n=1 Tax=Lentinus tigrinus ALCF2SS1-6 TaxID=1328759 RepID=A0A5C2SBK2_9APHY|nr:hypothetical protein L227DRAFT_652831 [Lentinus tigrinus ALCF2SS1-6]RPD75126.1 hypothetical protein L226DRAFT_55355 [Lentinus tigrinus ALCF2SS1-7]